MDDYFSLGLSDVSTDSKFSTKAYIGIRGKKSSYLRTKEEKKKKPRLDLDVLVTVNFNGGDE
jgi:hypothetical protein